MADYDVEVLGLKSPASTSPLAPYRLVVSVRNNGIHAAVASGYVRVYSTGLQIFESEVFSNTLAPGVTGDCSSIGYWTPPAEGFYMIQGYVSTPLDQVKTNNNLNPTNIHITGTPPTPPTPVALHAAQHEEDGTDELSIEGLPGQAADPQAALAHVASHQAGGTDALNVGSLLGVLATDQPAQVHSNTRHSPAMATDAELDSHRLAGAAHTAATNLANRETTGPDTGFVKKTQLSSSTEVPDVGDNPLKAGLRIGNSYGPVNAVHHAAKHAVGGVDEVAIPTIMTGIERNMICTPAGGLKRLVTLEMTALMAKPGTVGHAELSGIANTAAGIGQQVTFCLYHESNNGTLTCLSSCTFPMAANKSFTFHITAKFGIGILAILAGLMHGELLETATAGETHREDRYIGNTAALAETSRFFLSAIWVAGNLGSTLTGSDCMAMGVVRR